MDSISYVLCFYLQVNKKGIIHRVRMGIKKVNRYQIRIVLLPCTLG